MPTITTDHARHTSGATLAAAIESGTLTAGDAGAIAAHWQTPGGHGAVFATFACGMATDAADLLAAIDYESAHPVFANDAEALAELAALRDWVTTEIDDDDDDDDGCEGHESLSGAHMGETVYCDGTCR